MATYTLSSGPDSFPNAGQDISGDDEIYGLEGSDNISGGAGKDFINGGDGIDILHGGTGDDTLAGGQESDQLFGEDGDDYLDVGVIPGADVVDGGAGTDTIDINYSNVVFDNGTMQPIKVLLTFGSNFVTQIEGFVSVTASNVERLVFRGPEGADTIQGGALNDIIIGNGGVDTLRGGDGDDFLEVDLRVAGEDKDNIFGDGGNDTLGMRMETGVAKDTDDWVVAAGMAPTKNGVAVANVTSVEAFDVYIAKGKSAVLTGGAFADTATVLLSGTGTFNMGGGDDTLLASTTTTDALLVNGGDGKDNLQLSAKNGDLHGDGGDDSLTFNVTQKGLLDGGGGDDTLIVGPGFLFSFTNFNDRIIDGGSGVDTVVSSGNTIAAYTFRNVEKLAWSLAVDIRIAQIDSFATIGGGDSGPFVNIVGPGGVVDLNSRFAEEGVLSVRSYASVPNANGTGYVNDPLTLIGRPGGDQLFGIDGVGDTLIGNGGDDIIGGDYPSFGVAKPGDDTITGGAGNDTIDGGPGQDTAIYGGARADYAVTRLADGKIQILDNRGGSPDGADNLTKVEFAKFSDGTVFLAALLAIDGAGGDDARTGTAGDDLMRGFAGADTLDGGDGDDTIDGGLGADTLKGGAGMDIADDSEATGIVYLDLKTAATTMSDGTGSNDTLASIEGAYGGSGDDGLIGDAQANTFHGNGGVDVLLGGGGDDFLDGGAGERDYLMGGGSFDPGETATGADNMNGGAGVDVIYAQDGDDQIFGGDAGDFILAGAGNDTVDGGAGDDFIFAGADYQINMANAGNDILRGGDGLDFIVGGQGTDALFGDNGNDILYGGSGKDLLEGGAGDDSIVAGDGDDVLAGGAGANYLFGEGGIDTYVVRPGDGATIVFGATSDEHFRFQGFGGVASFAQLQPYLSAYGDGTLFYGPGAEYVIFEHAALSAANTEFIA